MDGFQTDADGQVILANPMGELETLDAKEAPLAIKQGGYSLPEPGQIEAADKEAKYGGLGQQAISGLEGAASAATFGLSTGLEELAGVNPEDIAARREVNPVTHAVGQLAGLVGSSALIPGGGAAGVLEKAGQTAAEATGLVGKTGIAAKIGSNAAKAAAENALFQTGDEVSKMISASPDVDPGEAVETAVTNIGLAALLGGGLGGGVGAVSPLWDVAAGSKMGALLKAVSDKAGGLENPAITATEDLAARAGVPLSAEARAVISKDPMLQDLARPLQDSQGAFGQDFNKAIGEFKTKLTDSVLDAVGKSSEDIAALSDFSANKAGAEVQEKLSSKIKEIYEPIKKDYEAISNRYSKEAFSEADRAALSEQFATMANESGWSARPSSPEAAFVNRGLKDIEAIDNLDKLRQFGDSLSKEAVGMNRFDISKGLGNLFDSAEDNFVKTRLSGEAPELLAKHEAVTGQYKELKSMINELNGRLKAGSQKGVSSFLYKLNDMVPEQLLNRLAQTKDADFIQFLNNKFPEIQSALKDYQINKVLKSAAPRLGSGEPINPTTLFKKLKEMSPELRNSLISGEGQAKLGAAEELWNGLHQVPKNYSGTAGTLERLRKYMPASMMGALSWLTGHSPIIGAILGHGAELVGHEVPDAVRLSLIKFLGSNQPVDAAGFKAMADFVQNTIKGNNLVGKATKAVFKAGQEVLPSAVLPTAKERDKLDSKLQMLQKDNSSLLNTGGKAPYYLPDHGASMGKMAANATNYLNSLRPVPAKMSPLDTEAKVRPEQKAEYDRALDIAQQPLVVMADIKNGTLKPSDVVHLKNLFPSLYTKLSNQLSHEMINAVDKGVQIPYKTKMGLSLFLGQPMDSTMTPMGIMAAQPMPQMAQQQPQGMPGGNHSLKSLGKMAPMYATGAQNREAHRAMK